MLIIRHHSATSCGGCMERSGSEGRSLLLLQFHAKTLLFLHRLCGPSPFTLGAPATPVAVSAAALHQATIANGAGVLLAHPELALGGEEGLCATARLPEFLAIGAHVGAHSLLAAPTSVNGGLLCLGFGVGLGFGGLL